jgi:hypothetical protein
MSANNNPVISLESNAVYIATSSVMQDGFHWTLIMVDASGNIKKHDWAETDKHPGGEYRLRNIKTATTYTNNNCVFAYMKVDGCHCPTVEMMQTIGAAIWPDVQPNKVANRQLNRNCRTWVFAALEQLRDKGYLPRPNLDGIEDQISAVSERLESNTATGAFEQSYVGSV